MNHGTLVASCPGNDVANDASLLPTNMALADRLCTWLQFLLSKALVHKSPKARGPEVEKSDERECCNIIYTGQLILNML